MVPPKFSPSCSVLCSANKSTCHHVPEMQTLSMAQVERWSNVEWNLGRIQNNYPDGCIWMIVFFSHVLNNPSPNLPPYTAADSGFSEMIRRGEKLISLSKELW